jgi:hypothetical protein
MMKFYDDRASKNQYNGIYILGPNRIVPDSNYFLLSQTSLGILHLYMTSNSCGCRSIGFGLRGCDTEV